MAAVVFRYGLHSYPPQLAAALAGLIASTPSLYVAGGAVRDWLAGNFSRDLDFTLPAGAAAFARRLAAELGGAFVLLDEGHDVARVVWQELNLDFSGFREGALTIEEDLGRRDFTINAMALRLRPAAGGCRQERELIDPLGGRLDLQAGLVRAVQAGAFVADPLRLLRAYRFLATLELPPAAGAAGFRLTADTEALIGRGVAARLIERVAVERIRAELDAILAGRRGAQALSEMAACNLLYQVLPELAAGVGLAQPGSHHLDVGGHSIEALARLGEVLVAPADFFPEFSRQLSDYLGRPGYPDRAITLRWAALLHDLGKPATHRLRGNRITFYNHDRIGAELCRRLALRLRFSRERSGLLQRLVANHMWPFHLSNARLKSGITPRACLRLVRAVGDDLPGLFLLAMADSLAGRGPGKPPDMERNLAALYSEVMRMARERIEPVLRQPPLLDGHDLQRLCGLTPGPLFKEILSGLEQARVAGEVESRQEARRWVDRFVERRRPEND